MKTYIKTDRNGSKHYEVISACNRCFGSGIYTWGGTVNGVAMYSGVCYKCGGSGKVTEKVIERTPEYQAKLDAKREAQHAKKQAEYEARMAARMAEEEARKAEEEARMAEEEARKAISQHIGQVGDKVQMEVTMERRGSYEVPSYAGFGTTTITVYTFVDSNGNKLVWKTGSGFGRAVEDGERLTIKGTIKGHGEYKGEKQTELQRVKLA